MTLRWIDLLNRIQKMDEFEIQKSVTYMDDEQFVTPVTNFITATEDISITHDDGTVIIIREGDLMLGGDIW